MEKIKILIADELPAFREGVRQAINNTSDMEVVAVAGDGEETLIQANEKKPHVAVISVTLPKLDGIAVTKKLKTTNPDIAIMLVSPYSHGSYIMPALRAGAFGYLTKTSPLEELILGIRSVKSKEIIVDSKAVGKLLKLMVEESNDKDAYIEKLHFREMEVMSLVAKGMSNHDIALQLGISDHTVHTHVNNIFKKLGVKSRTEATVRALRMGWVNFDDLT